MDGKDVLDLWDSGSDVRAADKRVLSYYKGKQTVPELNKPRIDGNNKSQVITNWTKYVVRMHAGFLTSRDANYIVDKSGGGKAGESQETALGQYREFYKANCLPAADAGLLADAIKTGRAVELHWFDGQRHRVMRTRPWEWVPVRNEFGDVVHALRRVVHQPGTLLRRTGRVLTEELTEFVYYTPDYIQHFEQDGNKSVKELKSEPNALGVLPLVLFEASEDGERFISDAFMTQCDVYDVSRSSLSDDIKHNVDSLLALKNMNFEQLLERDQNGLTILEKLKAMGILPLPGEASAEYVTRNVDVEKFKYDHRVTRASIHLMGCVPDLDETVGGNEGTITNISGIALKLMFHSMIQQSVEFEKHFEGSERSGLRGRVALWNRVQRALARPTLDEFDTKMERNIPFNDLELVQYLPNLKDVMSTLDRLKLLPFVEDPNGALQRLKEEQKEGASNTNGSEPPPPESLPGKQGENSDGDKDEDG